MANFETVNLSHLVALAESNRDAVPHGLISAKQSFEAYVIEMR